MLVLKKQHVNFIKKYSGSQAGKRIKAGFFRVISSGINIATQNRQAA
jgi:hypothetical protein